MTARPFVSSGALQTDASPNGTVAVDKRMMYPRQLTAGRLTHLRNIDIFSDIGDDELAELSDQFSFLTCEAGRLLYAPGEPGEALFLLGNGHVHLYRLSPNGRKLVVARLRAGAFFGAITMLGQEMYQTYAQTVDECLLWRLSHADSQRLLREKPEIALRLVAGLVERLRTLERHLEAMAFQNISARLAGLLLQLAAEQGDSVVQGYTHQDLADVLGAYRETISDTLNKFRADGLVRTGRKQIVLEDWVRLEKVAET